MGASNFTNIEARGYVPISATSSTAVAITANWPSNSATGRQGIPNYAIISPETSAIRWRDDGVAPTAAISGGMPLAVGQTLEFDGELAKLQVIAQAGTATVNVNFYNAF